MKNHVQVQTKFVPDLSLLPGLKRADIENGIHRSLSRLDLERLDLVQFHWWDYAVPGYLEALGVLDDLRRSGKIRLLGLTNFDVKRMVEIADTAIPVASLQLQYSLVDRRPLNGMAEFCQSHGISMLCYGAMAGGLLSDRYLAGARPGAKNRSLAKYRLIIDEAGGWQAFQYLLQTLKKIADRMQTGIASVAARWVLEQAGVDAVILGIGCERHLQANRHMLNSRLSTQSTAAIDQALARMKSPRGDVFALERMMDGPHAANIKMNLNADQAG